MTAAVNRRPRRVVVRLIGLLVALGAAMLVVPATAHADKSFSLASLETTAVVNADGSMDVSEHVTYVFHEGPFNFGVRSFDSATERARISDFRVSDDEGPLTIVPPQQSFTGQWEWQLRNTAFDDTIDFTVQYRVPDAVAVGDDVGELNWRFLGRDNPGMGPMKVTITLPPGAPPFVEGDADSDATVLRAFAHGPRDGTIAVGESSITATAPNVPSGTIFEIHAAIPATVFTIPSDGSSRLAQILATERKLLDDAADLRSRRRLGWVITPLLGALGLAGTAALWFVGGREPRSREVLGTYWREPLTDPPAIARASLGRGSVPRGTVIAATIVDLAQRGYLTIVGKRIERLGPDKTVHTFHWAGKELGPDVRPWERQLLDLVFRGEQEVTSEELTAWARTHQTTAKSKLDSIMKGVDTDFRALRYEQKLNVRQVLLLLALCAVVGGGGGLVVWLLHNAIGLAAVGLAVVLLIVGLKVLGNRSQAGAEAHAKAEGLRNFLRDFSRLEDAPVGHLILWERFLVYAVALGVSAELVAGLSARLPQILDNPAFGVWYVGPVGHFDGFDRLEGMGAATATASTPRNTSGGGGGFSGGSSGGGGGGGFGAH